MDTDTKLDYRIARDVMGWHEEDDKDWWYDGSGEPTFWRWHSWSPSTNWAHFGLVLEKAIARNPYLSLCLEQGLDGKSYLGIFTTGSGYKQTTVEQWGDGSLEAACLAILGAWGNGR